MQIRELAKTIKMKRLISIGRHSLGEGGQQFTMRTSVSFEQFIYNGEFDPGSG